MGFLSYVVTVLVSSSLLLWRVEVVAQLITTNIDTEEPSVITTPDPRNEGGFGWAAVFHRLEMVLPEDNLTESVRKTRYLLPIWL